MQKLRPLATRCQSLRQFVNYGVLRKMRRHFFNVNWWKKVRALRDESTDLLNLPGSEVTLDLDLTNGAPVTTYRFDLEPNNNLAHTEHTQDIGRPQVVIG